MRAVLLGLLIPALAAAQPPGAVAPVPAPSPPEADRRWSIGANVGSLGLAADRDDADTVTFGILELTGRFRIRPVIEVGLSVHGGGATKGTLETGGLYLDARYRFFPRRAWDLFAQLSLGVVSVANEDAPDDAKAGRGSVRFGIGVERRFTRWGLAAELRLVGIGENTDYEPVDPVPADEMATSKVNGGSLTIGGMFYF